MSNTNTKTKSHAAAIVFIYFVASMALVAFISNQNYNQNLYSLNIFIMFFLHSGSPISSLPSFFQSFLIFTNTQTNSLTPYTEWLVDISLGGGLILVLLVYKWISKPVPASTSIKPKCSYCGSEIPESSEYCPSCGRARVRCSVCNKDIFWEDRPVKCPHCGALSHREHLAEWIRKKGSCPKCGRKLKEITIVGVAPKAKCLLCGTEIPENAEYCPHCGEARARCSVCNKDIISGDRYVKCSYCGALSHRDHLLEWIKVQGYCPNCGENLRETDIA